MSGEPQLVLRPNHDLTRDAQTRRRLQPYPKPKLYGYEPLSPPKTSSQRNLSPARSAASQRTTRSTEKDLFPGLSYISYPLIQKELSRLKQQAQKDPNIIPDVAQQDVNGLNLRDTSVNVASAFTQAAQAYEMTSTSGSVTMNGNHDLPARRGLPGPPRSRAQKPPSKAKSQSVHDDTVRLRGKSPILETVIGVVRGLSPGGSAYVREGSARYTEVEDPSPYQSFSGLGVKHQNSATTLPPTQSQTSRGQPSYGNISSDYNYSLEDSMVNKMEAPRSTGPRSKKVAPRPSGAIPEDNKAYIPQEDEYSDEEEVSDGGGRRRKKVHAAQKKSTTLPVMGPQHHSKRKPVSRKRKGKDGLEEDDLETEPRASELRSFRGSVPPPVHDESWDNTYEKTGDSSHPIYADEYAIADEQAHPSHSSFSIGGLLGKIVNFFFRIIKSTIALIVGAISMVALTILRVIISIFDLTVVRPLNWLFGTTNSVLGALDWSMIGKAIVISLLIWTFTNSLYQPGGLSFLNDLPWSRPRVPIDYSSVPDASHALSDMSRRIQDLENKISDIRFEQKRASDKLENQIRLSSDLSSKVDPLESTLRQIKGRLDTDEKARAAHTASVANLRSEVLSLIADLGKVDSKGNVDVRLSDERIRALEERLKASEISSVEAIAALKQTIDTMPKSGGSGATGTRWWGSSTGSDTKFTITTTGGQDVTSLIGSLVDKAVLRWSKDDIAKPDYASYFAGARVVPQLTTQTYKITSGSSWGSWGWPVSSGTEGRPPVTALHPDIHVGNCWPFQGSQGQLGVRLARSVIITDFTIDHAAKEVAFNVRSAPKKMEVWGLVDGADNVKKVAEYHKRREQRYRDLVTAARREGRKPPPPEDPYPATMPPDAHYLRLAQFTYDVHSASHIQTFSVPQEIQDLGVDIGVVVLFIRSNWGEPDWTCLYRFRVSGQDVDRRPYPLPDIEDA